MIEKLTKLQEKKVPTYLNKWLKIGLRTKTTDRKKAKAAVNFLYHKILNMDKPKYVIYLDSPMACQLACNLFKNSKFDAKNLDDELYSQLDSQLGSQLYSQLDSQLGSQLGSQLYSQLDSQLYSQLGSQLYSQLDSQLGSQLDSQLGSQLYSQLGSQLYSQLGSQLYSQLDSQKMEYFHPSRSVFWMSYYGFYDYILNELLPKERSKFKLFTEFLKHSEELHYVYMFNEIAFVCDFPKAIHRNESNDLHHYDKAALEYRDTYALYMSNGIQMKKEYITTPKDQITKEMFLSEENVDVRREISRKLGIDKTIEMLGAEVVDTYKSKVGGVYELLQIDFDNRGNKRPYLKMSNPSLKGLHHIEGVEPSCKTVKEAIMFRNNLIKFIEPEALS